MSDPGKQTNGDPSARWETEEGAGLHDELVRFSLPDPSQDEARRYVWSISITLLFLTIGVLGAKDPTLMRRVLAPLEEPVVEQIEITKELPPETQEPTEQEAPEQNDDDAPTEVRVTLETPQVSFAVPTVGNVVVSAGAAAPPPARPMRTEPKVAAPATVNLQLTGAGGDYPQPTYPQEFIRRGLQGTIIIMISVDADGRKQNVEILETSGHSQLDDHVKLWVSKYYVRFPKADGPRDYKARFDFTITR